MRPRKLRHRGDASSNDGAQRSGRELPHVRFGGRPGPAARWPPAPGRPGPLRALGAAVLLLLALAVRRHFREVALASALFEVDPAAEAVALPPADYCESQDILEGRAALEEAAVFEQRVVELEERQRRALARRARDSKDHESDLAPAGVTARGWASGATGADEVGGSGWGDGEAVVEGGDMGGSRRGASGAHAVSSTGSDGFMSESGSRSGSGSAAASFASPPFLFVGVRTNASDRSFRDAARASWADAASHAPGIVVRFFAFAESEAEETALVREAKGRSDLVVVKAGEEG